MDAGHTGSPVNQASAQEHHGSERVWPIAFALGTFHLLARWWKDFVRTFLGNRGYLTVGWIGAIYFGIYGLTDAKHQQEETRAMNAYSTFITMVSAGNSESFVAAMKRFGPIQSMPSTQHPGVFEFWNWWRIEQTNLKPMWQWADARLIACVATMCGSPRAGTKRIDLINADLENADLHDVGLAQADLQGANLAGANLVNSHLEDADLTTANLTGAHLQGAKFGRLNASGTNLSNADLQGIDLKAAYLKWCQHEQRQTSGCKSGFGEIGRIEVGRR